MKLRTETNTQKVRWQVYDAARVILGNNNITTVFEHGQWWICDPNTGAQWSVCDAEGGDSIDGFCLEQVTPPDED